jgi:photosystem II stability/assembly factor-like uncharacterized protein
MTKKTIYLSILMVLSVIYSYAENWQKININTKQSLRAVKFTSTQVGYIVGDSGIILKTKDGGKTWFKKSLGSKIKFTCIDFITPAIGYVGGWGKNAMLKTIDSGNTWVVSKLKKTRLNDIKYISDSIILAAGYDNSTSTVGYIYRTFDNGNTWDSVQNGNANSLFITKAKKIFCIGDFAGISIGYSLDSGKNFYSYNGGRSASAKSIFFPDNKTGYFVGANKVVNKTSDFGKNWHGLTENFKSNVNYNSVFFLDSLIGYIAGDSGVLIKTDNGGKSWSTIKTNTTDSLRGITFLDASNGFVVGDNGIIMTNKTFTQIINDDFLNNSMLVYPNPTKDILNVKFTNPLEHSYKFRVINMAGKVISYLNIDQNSIDYTIDCTNWPSGIYLLESFYGINYFRYKIIKQN